MGALSPAGTAHRSQETQWPRIRADIDAGRLSMVGLVRHRGLNPFRLSQSHQVLAYGYRVASDVLTLRVYDPNWPNQDDIVVSDKGFIRLP
jgi:hypothetical protein